MYEKVNIEVKTKQSAGKLPHTWNYIGYDECNYTTSPGGSLLLKKFGELGDGPFFIRPHHLLCTGNTLGEYKWGSTNVYTEDEEGNPVYNFETLDKICDEIVNTGNKPFFEIGFMPRDLADTRNADNPEAGYQISCWAHMRDYQQKGWCMPPKDYDKWYDLIYAVVTHLVERHGAKEIEAWYFEMWNEPQDGGPYWKGTYEEFYKLNDYTEAAVHAALPTAKFGGPAVVHTRTPDTSGAKMFDDYLDHCKNRKNYKTGKTGTRLDYLSWHVKGGGYHFNRLAVKQIPSVKSFVEQNKTCVDIQKKHGFEGLEVVISEADPDGWAAGGKYDNFNLNFRNTEYYASYVASSYKNTYDMAEQEGVDLRPQAWAFMFDNERCFEGTRTFSTQGINKAVFNLFKLYAKLGIDRLPLSSSRSLNPMNFEDDYGTKEGPEIDGWATKKDDGSIQILVYCHHDDWDVKQDYQVTLNVDGLDDEYQMYHYRIDREHSNAYTEWVRQGEPDYPTGAQYDAIKKRDGLELLEAPHIICISQVKKLEFPLPVHGISFIELVPHQK
jgi:xylan 1,4-beta-xylosidase